MADLLPIFWGNKTWTSKDGILVPVSDLPQGDPNWIDYSKVTGCSQDLAKESHVHHKLRQQLHKQVLSQCIHGIAPVPEDKVPSCILTHGGIASGKTSAINLFRRTEETQRAYVHLDFDKVKRQLPEFMFMMDNKMKNAAEFTQEESAKLAGKAFKKAIQNRFNIIYEGSLQNTETIKDNISKMKKKGYEITIISTYVGESIGQARAQNRYQQGGRYVPAGRITETYKNCPASLVFLKDLVNLVVLVNNELEGQAARHVFTYSGKRLDILNSELYDEYIKANGLAARLD